MQLFSAPPFSLFSLLHMTLGSLGQGVWCVKADAGDPWVALCILPKSQVKLNEFKALLKISGEVKCLFERRLLSRDGILLKAGDFISQQEEFTS